jgi:hypothetical protein
MSRHRNIANIFFDGTRRHKSAALVAGLALNSSMALAQGRIQALIASAHQASESSIFADVSQVIPATITRSVPSFPVLHSDSEFKKIIA